MICILSVSPELLIRHCAAADEFNSTYLYSGVVDSMSKEPASASRLLDRPVIILELYSGEQP